MQFTSVKISTAFLAVWVEFFKDSLKTCHLSQNLKFYVLVHFWGINLGESLIINYDLDLSSCWWDTSLDSFQLYTPWQDACLSKDSKHSYWKHLLIWKTKVNLEVFIVILGRKFMALQKFWFDLESWGPWEITRMHWRTGHFLFYFVNVWFNSFLAKILQNNIKSKTNVLINCCYV